MGRLFPSLQYSSEEATTLFEEGKSLRQKIQSQSSPGQHDLEQLETIGNRLIQSQYLSEEQKDEIVSWFTLLREKKEALPRKNSITIETEETHDEIRSQLTAHKPAFVPLYVCKVGVINKGQRGNGGVNEDLDPNPWRQISSKEVLEIVFKIAEGVERWLLDDIYHIFGSIVDAMATTENNEGMTECLKRLQAFCIEHNVRDNTSRMLLTTIFVRRDLPEEDRQLFMAKFPDLFGVSLDPDSDDKEVEIEEAFEGFLKNKRKT